MSIIASIIGQVAGFILNKVKWEKLWGRVKELAKKSKPLKKSNSIGDENYLIITEYAKEGEVLRDGTPELKIIYKTLRKLYRYSPGVPILQMINDLRRIEQYHTTEPDFCIEIIRNQYPARWGHSTAFIECLKVLIDNNSNFMFQLRTEPFYGVLSTKVQQSFALRLQEARAESAWN
jgi:hypothetical protein